MSLGRLCWPWSFVSSLMDTSRWQTETELSGLVSSALSDLRLFSDNTSSAPGLHPSSCCVPPPAAQAGSRARVPSEVLLCIQVTDYTWFKTDWSKTDTFKMIWRNPETVEMESRQIKLAHIQRNYAHKLIIEVYLTTPHAKRTNRSLSYYAESLFVILSDAIWPMSSTTSETLYWNPPPFPLSSQFRTLNLAWNQTVTEWKESLTECQHLRLSFETSHRLSR